MRLTKIFGLVLLITVAFTSKIHAQKNKKQPNVLWLLTDDQRYDAIRSFNKMLHGREMSELGYVESPNVDRLTEMGTTFINTYCQAQGCAPSRASMHHGRYPFRSGVYEFEYHNNNAEHCQPTLPEHMANLGYQTLHIGKLGFRLRSIQGDKVITPQIYQTEIDSEVLARQGLCDWAKEMVTHVEGEKLKKPMRAEFFVTPEGEFEYISSELEKIYPEIVGTPKNVFEKYDLLRHYNDKKPKSYLSGAILAGVSSQPAGKTRDGYYSSSLVDFLKNENKAFHLGQAEFEGVNTSKPLFCHLGYDFPHTPVLPPADYRERFQKHTYKIPELGKNERATMPKQLKGATTMAWSDNLTDAEKQSMVQDYYAFCAYGDALIGQAADAFIEYSEKNKQPWIIVYVCGDHGWKLNEHGAVSKFTPWEEDSHNPIIVISSDKKAYPAGKVVRDYTEFVDISPTILGAAGVNLKDEKYSYLDGFDLQDVAAKKAPVRDYVIGESHAATGPRAYIRTKEYVFSMQTRPNKNRGENMEWALHASYEDIDPGLYHVTKDPKEINNLAFNKEYEKVAMAMKEKLVDIVLGDNRVEVDWGTGMKVTGTKVYRSNFAPGAHDYKLELE